MSAWLHSSKPDSTALLWRCQRNRLSPEDHLDVDQVASVYSSARGLSPLRPTSTSLTDTSTTSPLPSGDGRAIQLARKWKNRLASASQPVATSTLPHRAFPFDHTNGTKQHNEEDGYSTCIIPQHISHTSASGHHGLRHNTTRPA
jgi:hypothetical protein